MNQTRTLLASAARTASANSGRQSNPRFRGVIVIVRVTASAATPSVVATIRCLTSVENGGTNARDMLVSAAITGTGVVVLRVYPGIAAGANVAVSDVLPVEWDVDLVAANGDSLTYSVEVMELE